MEAHDAAVAAISERVKHFYARKEPFRMYHGSTNTTRRSTRRVDNTVDSSGLNHVLEVNTTTKTALVEPNVPMDALVDKTLKHGLVPLVVMEFPGITTGGGFSGTSGESSSFRYGVFEMTINSIEIVLADGTITRASRTEKPDLFWGAASAFGSLGVVTLLEVQLKEAKKYVELTYQLCAGPSDTVEKMREQCDKESNDYIDGMVLSNDSAVICAGRLVDELPQGQKPLHVTRRGAFSHLTKSMARDIYSQNSNQNTIHHLLVAAIAIAKSPIHSCHPIQFSPLIIHIDIHKTPHVPSFPSPQNKKGISKFHILQP